MTGNTLPDRDLELLSAYIDGELDDRSRADLERRLAGDAPLRDALADLRATVALVRELPRLKAPRSFALDPAVHKRRAPWWKRLFATGTVLQLSGALGAAASVVLIVAALLLNAPGTEEERALPPTPESQPTQVGFAPEPTGPPDTELRLQATATQAMPTASPPPVADMALEEDDGMAAFGGEVAGDAAGSAPPAAEMAPPPGTIETFDAAPAEPLAAGQSQPASEGEGAAQETAANSIPSDAEEAAPLFQAEQAEQPAPAATTIIAMPTGTATPAGPSLKGTLAPSATAPDVAPDEATARDIAAAGEAQAQNEESDHRWLAALGIVLLPVSLALFVFGRKKARRA